MFLNSTSSMTSVFNSDDSKRPMKNGNLGYSKDTKSPTEAAGTGRARPRRAVIYARFSSHNQDEISIIDQITICKAFIEENGYDLVGIYADEAKTGTNDRRDDFRRMMADAKDDLYDIVVVWNTDRLNRHMLNAFVMLADLFRLDKDLRSATQKDLNDPDNPMRMIMYALHTWKDEEVSNGISTNVRRGQGEKAGKCHPLGQLRFGWDIAGAYIDEHGKYHPATITRSIRERRRRCE